MPSPHEDFLSAALRHIRDAESLNARVPDPSADQAWHLAGFAHECARKAYLQLGWVPKLLGHEFSAATEEILEFAIALDSRSGRFPVREWTNRHPAVSSWRAEQRYERTGTAASDTQRDIPGLLRQGREAVEACTVALFLDGALSEESLA